MTSVSRVVRSVPSFNYFIGIALLYFLVLHFDLLLIKKMRKNFYMNEAMASFAVKYSVRHGMLMVHELGTFEAILLNIFATIK